MNFADFLHHYDIIHFDGSDGDWNGDIDLARGMNSLQNSPCACEDEEKLLSSIPKSREVEMVFLISNAQRTDYAVNGRHNRFPKK